MVIPLGDHPQAQLCPAWQRQGQAPSHHLHTALEWGQCPPQRGWEKPLSRGHLLGDGGLSEPHEPPPSGQGGDTRQHSPGTGRGPAISTGESCPPCLLEAGEVSCCPVFDSVLVPCLLRVPPSPPPRPVLCMGLHVAEAITPHGTRCLVVTLPCRLAVPGDRDTAVTSTAELLMAGRQGTGMAGRQAVCCSRVAPGCPHCPQCPLVGGGCSLAPGTMQGAGMDDEDSWANSWGTAWQQCQRWGRGIS